MTRFRTRNLAVAAGLTRLATGISAPAASAAVVQTGTITPWDITSGTKIDAPHIQGSYTSKNFYCVG